MSHHLIFLDTEFTALKQDSQLLSIALVAESGEKFYAEFNDCDSGKISDWVSENVISHFEFNTVETIKLEENRSFKCKGNQAEITGYLKDWLSRFGDIQVWADVPHYDWVLFCELFDGSLHLPANVDYMCLDLATLLYIKGIDVDTTRIELLEKDEIPTNYKAHHALFDAEVGIAVLKKLLNGKR